MLEETEQKDIEEEESVSEASEIRISDNKSSEDECSNLGGIKFTVKRDWEGQVTTTQQMKNTSSFITQKDWRKKTN